MSPATLTDVWSNALPNISPLSFSGHSFGSGGSWYGDSYRESSRRGFGLDSSGPMPEDVEASHSEIFIQVCNYAYHCVHTTVVSLSKHSCVLN